MGGKKIIWSDSAKNELHKALEFYIERNGSPNYSLKLLDQTQDLMTTLSKNELIGRLTSNKTTRVIPFKEYLIFYEVKDDCVEIHSFWDNRQDEQKLKI